MRLDSENRSMNSNRCKCYSNAYNIGAFFVRDCKLTCSDVLTRLVWRLLRQVVASVTSVSLPLTVNEVAGNTFTVHVAAIDNCCLRGSTVYKPTSHWKKPPIRQSPWGGFTLCAPSMLLGHAKVHISCLRPRNLSSSTWFFSLLIFDFL